MNTRPRAKPASKPAQLGAPSQLAAETKPAAPAPASSSESFSDVNDVVEASAVIEPMSPKQLLKGTELEAAPERRGPPVPVVKVGQAVPLAARQPDGPPAAAAAPKPVAVIKPQKRSTIGDMLRAARGGPSASTNGAPTNGGYAVVNTQPAPVQPQPASFPSGPAPSGGYPVNTGSRAAAAAAAAAGGSEQTSAEVMPVRYNNDGSVVLASKPIPVRGRSAGAAWGRVLAARWDAAVAWVCHIRPAVLLTWPSMPADLHNPHPSPHPTHCYPAAGQARAPAEQDGGF